MTALSRALCGRDVDVSGPGDAFDLGLCVHEAVERAQAAYPEGFGILRLRGSARVREGSAERAVGRWRARLLRGAERVVVEGVRPSGRGRARWAASGPAEVMRSLSAGRDGVMREGWAAVTSIRVEAWRDSDDPRIRSVSHQGARTEVEFDTESESETGRVGEPIVNLVVELRGVPDGADPERLLDRETSPWWQESRPLRMGPPGARPSFRVVSERMAQSDDGGRASAELGRMLRRAAQEWRRMQDDRG